MLTTEMPSCACPVCKAKLDRASDMETQYQPKPKDLSVCLYCAAVLQFDAAMMPRLMTQAEVQALPKDTLAELVRMVRDVKRVMIKSMVKKRLSNP